MSNTPNINERVARWLIRQPFFHGYLPREDLPFILKKRGDYILRLTERTIDKIKRKEIILSVSWPADNFNSSGITQKEIKNLILERSRDSIYIEKASRFFNMESLIDHYKKNPIRIDNMPIRLIKSISLVEWEFRHSQILLIKKVGQGAYGEVYKGKLKKGKKKFDVAIKMMKVGDAPETHEGLKEVMAEARLMRCLNHPNIVRIRGMAVLEQPFYIVIDFITGGGLDSYLKKNAAILKNDIKNKMAISAAWGIEYMHSQDIIHRDIAARNCLYDPINYVKLSDFGLSRKGGAYKMKKMRKMPTKWLAPESLQTFMFYRASDVYTFGVLLTEIYTCQEPYKDVGGTEARKRICTGIFPNFEIDTPIEIVKIVNDNVFIYDHTKRSTMKKIVKLIEDWLQVELKIEQDEIDKHQDVPFEIEADQQQVLLNLDDLKVSQFKKKQSEREVRNSGRKKDTLEQTKPDKDNGDEFFRCTAVDLNEIVKSPVVETNPATNPQNENDNNGDFSNRKTPFSSSKRGTKQHNQETFARIKKDNSE